MKKYFSKKILIILFFAFIYFLYYGQIYIKWIRFMSPIFFVFPLLTAYFIANTTQKILRSALIFICIIPGLLFLTLYLKPDIRLQASDWIIDNLPPSSTILSEGGNVINLPLGGDFDIRNFDFYTLDHQPQKIDLLARTITDANYIINPSRRIYRNQLAPDFPQSQCYFDNLFSGKLGFELIKQFSPTNEIINGVNAEETWTVFDRPTIRIFKKTNPLTSSDYLQLINCRE